MLPSWARVGARKWSAQQQNYHAFPPNRGMWQEWIGQNEGHIAAFFLGPACLGSGCGLQQSDLLLTRSEKRMQNLAI